MLSLPSRALALRSLFSVTPSHVIARHFAWKTEPTRGDTATVDGTQANSMDQITDILDDADLSKSPRSNNFSGKPLLLLRQPSPPQSVFL
jgi:hypothetical protein